MKIKAGTIPGVINDFGVADNSTVADVLRSTGIDADGGTVTLNGIPCSLQEVVSEGARVVVTRNAKGN